MNGHFEVATSAYPYGYLRAGDFLNGTPLYRLTDMRSLESVDSRALTNAQAVEAASRVNKEYRAGVRSERIEQVAHDIVTDVLAGN